MGRKRKREGGKERGEDEGLSGGFHFPDSGGLSNRDPEGAAPPPHPPFQPGCGGGGSGSFDTLRGVGEAESHSCSATPGSSVWTPGSVCSPSVEGSHRPPVPSGARVPGIIRPAAQRIAPVSNSFCVHSFV